MRTDSIINFIEINDRLSTAGQPTKEQLTAARDEGYQAVVNLAPTSSKDGALMDEAETVNALGMTYHHIPVAWNNPRREEFVAFSKVLHGLRDKKVLIHCAANYRVTAFYSAYAMKHEGWTPQQADQLLARIWESRPDYRMDDTWKSFIDEIRQLDPQ